MEKSSIESFSINLSPRPETCLLFSVQLRPHITELLLDQIPVLSEFQRFLDQLTILEPPPAKNELILEQVMLFFRQWLMPYTGECISLGIDFQTEAVCN